MKIATTKKEIKYKKFWLIEHAIIVINIEIPFDSFTFNIIHKHINC